MWQERKETTMKVGIHAVDSVYANFALLKVAGYYKDCVEWHNPMEIYDEVYISKVFVKSMDYPYAPDHAFKGGPGYQKPSFLPEHIENSQPNYAIYPTIDYSIQRYSSGCIRNCPWCIVPKYEGKLKVHSPVNLNPKGKWIFVIDNNFFASKAWRESIHHLQSCNQPVHFDGIDVRLLNEEKCYELNKLKLHKQLHIAWDDPRDTKTLKKIEQVIQWLPPRKLMCYILIGHSSTEEEDVYRATKLKEMGIDPYAMPFDRKQLYQQKFCGWVNHKPTFKKVEWKDYVHRMKKKTPDIYTERLFT
jgi:hypothetical protein